jgi:riboflavin kinase/FMN adenylyltransferase
MALHRKVIPLWGIFAVRVDGPGFTRTRCEPPARGRRRWHVRCSRSICSISIATSTAHLDVDFIARLRDEVRFESLDALVEQMQRDAAEARASL